MNRIAKDGLLRRMFVHGLTLLAFVFVLFLLWRERLELLHWVNALRPGWMLVSLTLLLAANASAGVMFAVLAARRSAASKPLRRSVGAFLLGQVGKYLPGRIWGVAQQAALLTGSLRPGVVILANLEVFMLVLILTAGVGASLLLFEAKGLHLALSVMAATLVVVAVLTRANVLERLVMFSVRVLPSRLARVLDSASEPASGRHPRGRLAFFASLGFALAFALGWFLLLNQALGFGGAASIRMTAILALSSIIGMLSMLPGGLGAREAAMLGLGAWLASDMTVMASVAVLTRAAIVVIDLVSAGAGAVLLGKLQSESNVHE